VIALKRAANKSSSEVGSCSAFRSFHVLQARTLSTTPTMEDWSTLMYTFSRALSAPRAPRARLMLCWTSSQALTSITLTVAARARSARSGSTLRVRNKICYKSLGNRNSGETRCFMRFVRINRLVIGGSGSSRVSESKSESDKTKLSSCRYPCLCFCAPPHSHCPNVTQAPSTGMHLVTRTSRTLRRPSRPCRRRECLSPSIRLSRSGAPSPVAPPLHLTFLSG